MKLFSLKLPFKTRRNVNDLFCVHSEDYLLVQNVTKNEERMRIFTGIRSAAESGWDFSSRHMRGPNNSTKGKPHYSSTLIIITRIFTPIDVSYAKYTFKNCSKQEHYEIWIRKA